MKYFLIHNRYRLGLIALIAVILVVFYVLGLDHYLSLAYLQSREIWLKRTFAAQPFLWALTYFVIYAVLTGLSLPLAVPITLVAGGVLGVVWGSLVVTVAAAIGASMAFLAARFLFRDWVQAKFSNQLYTVNRGIESDGIFYLFLLRLIPAFPFFIINLVMGLTSMRLRTYFWVSLIGMIPGNVLYINAGAQLSHIRTLQGLFSPQIIASFIAVGVFPLLLKKTIDKWRG